MPSGNRSTCRFVMRRLIQVPLAVLALLMSPLLADEQEQTADSVESRHIARQTGYLAKARLPAKADKVSQ